MKPQRRGSPFGERISFILMNERGLQVYRAPRSVDRFNLLRCPGVIVGLMLNAWETVRDLAELVAEEGERRGLDVHTQVRQGEIWMAFGVREVTLVLLQDRTWLIRTSVMGVVSFQEGGFERVLEVIAQQTGGAFLPACEPTLERDTSGTVQDDLATPAG